mmetsp:Transcript_224/g.646  ORF Transcript_224/g.646 Transcript_224/m.646 type:complete len:329 (+) Transcript_224:4411-5397(+)
MTLRGSGRALLLMGRRVGRGALTALAVLALGLGAPSGAPGLLLLWRPSRVHPRLPVAPLTSMLRVLCIAHLRRLHVAGGRHVVRLLLVAILHRVAHVGVLRLGCCVHGAAVHRLSQLVVGTGVLHGLRMALHARHHCAHAGGADGVRHVHGRHLLPAAAALVRAGALLRLPPRLRHLLAGSGLPAHGGSVLGSRARHLLRCSRAAPRCALGVGMDCATWGPIRAGCSRAGRRWMRPWRFHGLRGSSGRGLPAGGGRGQRRRPLQRALRTGRLCSWRECALSALTVGRVRPKLQLGHRCWLSRHTTLRLSHRRLRFVGGGNAVRSGRSE